MRVLIGYCYALNTRDAVANAINELAEGLKESGIETTVYKRPDPYENRSQPVAGSARELLRKVNRLKGQLLYLFGFGWFLARSLTATDCVVTLDTPSGIGTVGKLSKILTGGRIKHIVWIMDLYRMQEDTANRRTATLIKKIRLSLETASTRSADRVVVLGQCMQTELARNNIPDATVIPIWHESSHALPISIDVAKNMYGRSHQFVVMYSGNAGIVHPLAGLVQAAEILKNQHNIRFIISGQGISYDAARELAAKSGITNIDFPPRVPFDELAMYLSSADLHVVSLSEISVGSCVPSKAYGAMAAARPVLFLGSNTCQISLDIEEAQCGVTVPTNDAKQIADAILNLYRKQDNAVQMGQNALKYFTERRSLTSGVARWSALLQEMRD